MREFTNTDHQCTLSKSQTKIQTAQFQPRTKLSSEKVKASGTIDGVGEEGRDFTGEAERVGDDGVGEEDKGLTGECEGVGVAALEGVGTGDDFGDDPGAWAAITAATTTTTTTTTKAKMKIALQRRSIFLCKRERGRRWKR
ncbi:hypothetical protein Dimus_005643 [Dionaea muscipula]